MKKHGIGHGLKIGVWIGDTGSWSYGFRSRSGAISGMAGHGKTPSEAKEDYDRKMVLNLRKELKK